MSKINASLVLSAANSYLGLVLQLISTAIIARLLTPEDLGTFALAAVLAAVASTFRDFGVAEYMIQAPEVTREVVSASLAMNLILSWGIALVMLLASMPVAEFYGSAGVGAVMRVQALSFLLIPFGAVTLAWYRREMDFRPIFLAGVASHVLSFAVAVGLVLAGLTYMSLAWSSVAGVAATVAVAVWRRPNWFPLWPSLRGVRQLLRFGSFVSGTYMVTQLGRGAPELVIGKFASLADVGLFSRAAALVEMFNRLVVQASQPVFMPYLAEGLRKDRTVVPSLLRAMSTLTVVGWPFLAVAAALAFPAIRLIYGVQWVEVVPLAQVLCLAAAIELVHRLSNNTLLSLGRADAAFRLELGVQSLRVMGVCGVMAAGLVGAAWGLSAAAAGGLALKQWALSRHAGLGLGDVVGTAVPSAMVTAATAAPVLLLVWLLPPGEANFLWVGLAGGLLAVGAWILAVRALGHPIWTDVLRMLQLARQRTGRSGPEEWGP